MVVISPVKGLSVGLEYFESETWGFGIILDLALLRVMWYRDVTRVYDDDDNGEEDQ